MPAQRPDGSTVYVSPSTAARYRGEDAEQVPAAGEPDPAVAAAADPVAEPIAESAAESEPVAEPAASSATAEPGGDFALGADVLAPSAAKQRARANLNALALVASLVAEDRPATADEQRVLAQWSGWGGVPQIFDTAKTEFDAERVELQELLTPREYDAARLSTVNAHYTDPAIAAAMWRAVERAGLPEGARVLEPGCGSGHFLGSAPEGVKMVGVELDPITAQIAHHLYPGQQVRNHGFEAPFADNGAFTATIGNVPFGNYAVYDDVHNRTAATSTTTSSSSRSISPPRAATSPSSPAPSPPTLHGPTPERTSRSSPTWSALSGSRRPHTAARPLPTC
ncbi:hypothetical protein GS584_25120 [Rhodococcus hoagii]|nr:hypothetical protein [Prescottella equi]